VTYIITLDYIKKFNVNVIPPMSKLVENVIIKLAVNIKHMALLAL